MVLDALADDVETIYTMRLCGDVAPTGLAVVGEVHILDALRSLLADELVGVWREYVILGDWVIARSPVGDLGTTDDDLRRYWFEMTQAGRERREAAASDLEAYWDTHPLEPRDDADACGLDDGFSTPEEAARGDIPARFCTVLEVRIEGNEARVWMLTNDRPRFEPYEVVCVRRRGRWFGEDGFGGISLDAPPEVLEAARHLGW
jgi:hypothetical protein